MQFWSILFCFGVDNYIAKAMGVEGTDKMSQEEYRKAAVDVKIQMPPSDNRMEAFFSLIIISFFYSRYH
jgi:hypothetical protein